MPARKKPPHLRQRREPAKRTLVALPSTSVESEAVIPPLPSLPDGERWSAASRQLWQKFWTSDIAQATDGVDVTIVERWIYAHEEWLASTRSVRRARVVEGSAGQPTLNPLAAWAKSQADEMRRCEASLGIGPKERASLGFEIGRGKMTVAQLNTMTYENHAPDAAASDLEAEVYSEFDEG